NAITTEFWLAGIYLDTLGGIQIFEGQISDATPTVMGEFRIDPTAITTNLGLLPIGPYPVAMPANALVQGRAGGAAAKVIGVSLLVATGL
ncbi:MAG: hypothetical protein Q8R28_19735, partial [Dehalococcoidia bacterium]|nr:hypothetical protein [Dehalococcoidia bacterium]